MTVKEVRMGIILMHERTGVIKFNRESNKSRKEEMEENLKRKDLDEEDIRYYKETLRICKKILDGSVGDAEACSLSAKLWGKEIDIFLMKKDIEKLEEEMKEMKSGEVKYSEILLDSL